MKRLVFGLLPLPFIASLALAHAGATGIVKVRMHLMSTIGQDTRAMARIAKGQTTPDWTLIKQAGNNAFMVGQDLGTLFPIDSFKRPSEAKQAILELPEDFALQSKALENAGLSLIQSAESQDKIAFQAAFQAYAATCKACHSKFRK